MRTLTTVVRAHRFARASDRARLVVIDGPDRGAFVTLGPLPSRIGSGADAALALTDPAVSRAHAEVRWDAGAMVLVDSGSKNGTFAAGCRVHHVAVPPGGELRIGATLLRVVPEDEPLDPQPSEATASGELVGGSHVMRQLFTLLDQVARGDAPLLVEGERGTGKQTIAREVHRRSRRAEQPFVLLDCAQADDDDTLDASFVDADGGTLCLIEVGELSATTQAALLRVLDRKLARPPGTATFRSVDVRVIATTRHDLAERITLEQFREDLYYRLAVVRMQVPPLRERRDDIPLLVEHFRAGRALSDPGDLAAREWPSNVRELRDAVEALAVGVQPRPSPVTVEPAAQPSFRDAKAAAIDAFERRFLGELMEKHGSLAAAASAAAMDRKHLRVLLRRHGLRDG